MCVRVEQRAFSVERNEGTAYRYQYGMVGLRLARGSGAAMSKIHVSRFFDGVLRW